MPLTMIFAMSQIGILQRHALPDQPLKDEDRAQG